MKNPALPVKQIAIRRKHPHRFLPSIELIPPKHADNGASPLLFIVTNPAGFSHVSLKK
jgi:hypothetical protein